MYRYTAVAKFSTKSTYCVILEYVVCLPGSNLEGPHQAVLEPSPASKPAEANHGPQVYTILGTHTTVDPCVDLDLNLDLVRCVHTHICVYTRYI